ncbi:2-iminobutanoate/2-iminopropanoate deaminase-like [Agrilus planipennis]|uniref:2-iminobutanoate/2-iminopropanoate deaminase-like n=1 Tax=Agrilus planipennis TaxID=224129 RepID=A0A1W4XJ82_AGRPL|nr:2-iminobutanoate/2-iminopropanoate deaminase-like [Agrilus planipennis]
MAVTKRNIISCCVAPPTGPYSHAVLADNVVYVSGTFGIDRRTGEFVCGGTGEEFRQALRNMRTVLKEAGSDFDKVVKVNIILRNMKDLCIINNIYKEYFYELPYPARTIHQGKLPMSAAVEIEAVALSGPVDLGE